MFDTIARLRQRAWKRRVFLVIARAVEEGVPRNESTFLKSVVVSRCPRGGTRKPWKDDTITVAFNMSAGYRQCRVRVERARKQAIDLACVGEEPLVYGPRKLSCGRVSGWLCRCGVSLARNCTPLVRTPAVWEQLSHWLAGLIGGSLEAERCLMPRDLVPIRRSGRSG